MFAVEPSIESSRLTIFADLPVEPVTGLAKVGRRVRGTRMLSATDVKGVVADPRLYGRILTFESGISCLLVSPGKIEEMGLTGRALSLSFTRVSRGLFDVKLFKKTRRRRKGKIMTTKEIEGIPEGFLSAEQFALRVEDRRAKNEKAIAEAKTILSTQRTVSPK